MKKTKIIYSLAAGLITAAPAYSSPAEILTWEDCVEEAIGNNPEILVSDERLFQAKIGCGANRSGIFPSISAGASWRN